jgi:hypothetical protein
MGVFGNALRKERESLIGLFQKHAQVSKRIDNVFDLIQGERRLLIRHVLGLQHELQREIDVCCVVADGAGLQRRTKALTLLRFDGPSLTGFKRAIGAAAGLLLDDHRIDCAFELRDAFGCRARRALRNDARDR